MRTRQPAPAGERPRSRALAAWRAACARAPREAFTARRPRAKLRRSGTRGPGRLKAFLFSFVFAAYVILGDLHVRLLRILYTGGQLRDSLRRQHIWLAGTVLRLARIMTGLRLVVESDLAGPPPPSVLVISNHQSILDIPFMVYVLPNNDAAGGGST